MPGVLWCQLCWKRIQSNFSHAISASSPLVYSLHQSIRMSSELRHIDWGWHWQQASEQASCWKRLFEVSHWRCSCGVIVCIRHCYFLANGDLNFPEALQRTPNSWTVTVARDGPLATPSIQHWRLENLLQNNTANSWLEIIIFFIFYRLYSLRNYNIKLKQHKIPWLVPFAAVCPPVPPLFESGGFVPPLWMVAPLMAKQPVESMTNIALTFLPAELANIDVI